MATWSIVRSEAGGFTVIYESTGRAPFICGEVKQGTSSRRMVEEWCISQSSPCDLIRVEGREFFVPRAEKQMVLA
jgi:hypothetical protein